MNTTTRFFQTKEQHKAFRIAFAAGQNDKRNRKVCSLVERPVWRDNKYVTVMVKEKSDCWMNSAHFLLFNLVCGRDFYNGFSPKTKAIFLTSGGNPDRGMNGAIEGLGRMIASAQTILKKTSIKIPSWNQRDKETYITKYLKNAQGLVEQFLEPLGGAITVEDLARIQLPPVVGISHLPEDHKEKPVMYKNIIGPCVIDQTMPETAPPITSMGQTTETYVIVSNEPEKKKGFLGRLFS